MVWGKLPQENCEIQYSEMASGAIFGSKIPVFALVLTWKQNFDSLHVQMHGDQCPSTSVVSGTSRESLEGAAHASSQSFAPYLVWILFSKQHQPQMSGHHAQNLLVLTSPQLSLTFGP